MWMIISDSHDNLDKIRHAVKIAHQFHVNAIFHLGDFVSPFVIPILLSDEYKFFGVFGNNDGDRLLVQEKAKGQILRSPNWVTFQGKKIYLMHEPRALYPALESQKYDFVFFGHTHRLVIMTRGKSLVINPGESCGYLTGRATCVLLDPEVRKSRVMEL